MTNPPAPLTLARLIELGACERGLELFESTFGDSVDMANPPKGYEALDFDWEWAAINLLHQPARVGCPQIAARAERDKTRAAARAHYDKTRAAARANFNEAIAAAWSDYDKISATTRANFNKAIAAARPNYRKTIAPAFVACYVATFYRQHGDN